MSGDANAGTTLVCCGVFRAEIEVLCRDHWPRFVIRELNSMLHMRPSALAARLGPLVDEELARGQRLVIVYGDCCERMAAFQDRPGVVRTQSNNCCELLLGREEYRRQARAGAFFLLPEWARRWQRVFAGELGLNRDNAIGLMRDLHQKLVYLDTGITPVPTESLVACARFCGLPWEVQPVSLEVLRGAIEEAIGRLPPPVA